MRPIWSGIISFGLINIPVKLYSATQDRKLDFNFLSKKDMCPIKYVRVCKTTGEEVPYRDIVRGYQYEKGNYVVLEEDDFKRADAKKTQAIEVREFSPLAEIDFKLYEKTYFIEPDKGAEKAYVLLREALKKTGKAGIANFVMHNKEYLVALIPDGSTLVLNQLRFADQVRKPDELRVPDKADFSEKEIEIAVRLVEELSESFQAEKYKDTYTEELKKTIEQKIRGEKPAVPEGTVPRPTAVPDIMIKLKESLEYAKRKK